MSGSLTVKLFIRDLCAVRLPQLVAAVDAALDDADVVVSHPAAALVSRIAAEPRGIPWITADMIPMLIPTGDHPPDPVPIPARWPSVNRFVWRRVGDGSALLGGESLFRAARANHGLETPKRYVFEGRISPRLHLGLVSSHYVDAPSDLPSYRSTGFTAWTTPADALAPDVAAFLDAGEPPVVVTFGTSASSAAPELFGVVAASLDRLGLRGLFLTGTESNAAGLAGRDGVWPFVPLGPVLPRCRAVVQSGAHGTNALVLEAGLPSVVVPQLFDQVWHGRRVEALGLGRLVRRPSAERLSEAIEDITSDPSYADRARSFATLVADERGAERAADEIERVLSDLG
ncbi:MAG TPA: nucleotide disphospho-sugar-binding domain-containing protein [Microthrixaceae bacterium]|nr:nucleotide disphospho-sugar-binding domain-containing protein [Microthrixaceae bacterium]